jgi:hypothetical protein
MKKIVFLIIYLFIIKNAYTQYFVTQRVKYENNWEKVLIDKKTSINYVEIRNIDNEVLFVVDSGDFVLIDANKIGDSLELFYKTSLNKIIINKVKLPLEIDRKKVSRPFEYRFLQYDPLYKINYDLSDTLTRNEIHQEFLKVYKIDNIELAINDRSFLRAFKDKKLIWQLFKYQSTGMFNIVASHDKREILDSYENKILYLYYNSGGFWKAPENCLLEIDIHSGKVLFKSPFEQNINAFYLKNGNILFIVQNNANNNNVYIYDKKKREIDYSFSLLTNAILIQ